MDWKQIDAQYAEEQRRQLQQRTPEPLFEAPLDVSKVCLRCGQQRATSLLRSAGDMQPVLPLCASCAAEWNLYGYQALKHIRPRSLLWNLAKYKLRHPFGRPSTTELIRDVRNLLRWVSKMTRMRRRTRQNP
jgi:hypothetical protein